MSANETLEKTKGASVFKILNAVDVSEHTEKKNGLTYLSWAWAWGCTKKLFPEAFYTIYENKDGINYHHDGRTGWVKTGVTIDGLEHIEYLPVMDFRNKSIPLNAITSFDVNKAIQRSLTKAIARHGLGLYIYAGEDLPIQDEIIDEKIETKKIETNTNTVEQVLELESLMIKANVERQHILNFFKAKTLEEIDFNKCKRKLEATIKSRMEKAS